MRSEDFRILRLCALFTLLVVLLSPVIGACHDDERCIQEYGFTDSHQSSAPCCPDADHHNPAHDNCSTCPCHAPLIPTQARISIICLESSIAFSEKTHFLPDVYLSLFDPPDVTA